MSVASNIARKVNSFTIIQQVIKGDGLVKQWVELVNISELNVYNNSDITLSATSSSIARLDCEVDSLMERSGRVAGDGTGSTWVGER